jgi:hypothetical protein
VNPIRLAALAAAIAAAHPAAAQRASPSASRTPRGAAAPAVPSAPVAAPAAAPAPAAHEYGEPAPEWRVGPALAYEFGMGDLDYGGPQLRIEASRVVRRVSPLTTVSFVGSFSVTHAAGDEEIPILVASFPVPVLRSATIEWDANVFELVPTARVTYSASPKIAFFADGGAGLVYSAGRVHLPPQAASLPESEVLSDGVGGVVRLAGGLVFTPSPALRLSVQAIGLDLRFGDGPGTGFALGASLSHRL